MSANGITATIPQIIAPGEVVLEERTLDPPEEGQVLLELVVTLPSPGTELAVYGGYHQWLDDPDHPWSFPFHPGYAAVGRVAGGESDLFDEGDLVFTGRCGHGTHAVVRADDREPIPLPNGLAPERAVFAGLARFSLGALMMARPIIGRTVAVQGLGAIGQLALRLMRAAGAYPLIGVDMVPFRQELAVAGGADLVLDAEGAAERIREETGAGADIVVDATGIPNAVPQGWTLAEDGAQVIIVGSPRGRADGVNFYPLHNRCLEVVGAHGSFWWKARDRHLPMQRRKTMEMLLAWLADGRVGVDKLITARRPLAELQAVYDSLRDDKDQELAPIIVY